MFGFGSKKQEVNLRIDTCSSCGMFQKHAERSLQLIQSWLDPKRFTLKTTINAGDPKHVEAFELWVNGQLVHSEQQRNHGYLDSHPDEEHKEGVRMAIQEIIAGHRAVMPVKQEKSEIKIDKQRKQEHKDQIAMKKRELEDAQKSKHREEVLKKKAEADEKKQAQKEETKLKKAAKGKKQKEATAKRSAKDPSREEAQKRKDVLEEKGEADAQADGEREREAQAIAETSAQKEEAKIKRLTVSKGKKQKDQTTKRSADDFRREEAQKRKEEIKEEAEAAAVAADAQAFAKASASEALTAQEKASQKEAQTPNVEAEDRAKAESLGVDAQADAEREEELQALAQALAADGTMVGMQRQPSPPSNSSASYDLVTTLPFAAGEPRAGQKNLQTPLTTAGTSMNSSWEAPSETEQYVVIQSASKKKPIAPSPAVVVQSSTGLALLFGFACCRSPNTSGDSVGDIAAASA